MGYKDIETYEKKIAKTFFNLAEEIANKELKKLKLENEKLRQQLRLHSVVRSGNLPNVNKEFIEARKQFAKACDNHLNSKEHKAMIESFKKVGAID